MQHIDRMLTNILSQHSALQQEELDGRADSPPPAGGSSESWRKDIGLRSQSSCSEVIYSPPEWYNESPALLSLLPATKKCSHDELEKDINELTTDSERMSDGRGRLQVSSTR